jgi:hypothetical protein
MYPSVYGTANLVLSAPMFDRVTIDSAGPAPDAPAA